MQRADETSKNLIYLSRTLNGRGVLPEWAVTGKRLLIHAFGVARLWYRRWRQRTELRSLLARDQRFFYDIGVPRATVDRESRKWFWQA